MLAVQPLDPGGLLVGFGVFALVTALIYRRPVPVQPMKVVAAVAIAGGLSAEGVSGSGLLLGVVLLVLALFGLVGRLGRLIPETVMNGVQLGVGLYLAMAGIELVVGEVWLGIIALSAVLLMQLSPLRPAAALLVLSAAAAWGVSQAPQALDRLDLGLFLPVFALPGLDGLRQAGLEALLPQLALTLTNATVITAAIAAEYFPRDRDRITPDRLALSTGALNLLLAPLGAIPMCHGAGGLVVQHRFGARTGLAPAIFGISCLLLGLFLGPNALLLLASLPMAAVGALLVVAGVDLAITRRLRRASPDRLLVITLTGLACVAGNVALGLLVGILLEWLRARRAAGSSA